MQAHNYFSKAGRRIRELIGNRNLGTAERIWDEFCNELDQNFSELSKLAPKEDADNKPVATTSNPVPQAIRNLQQLTSQSPVASPSSIAGMGTTETDEDSGYPLRLAVVASGESVTPGAAIHVAYGVASLATAASDDKQCSGVAVRGTSTPGQILYRCGGTVYGQLAQPITVGRRLWLSVTPGKFTDVDNEVGKVIHQDCGQFHELLPGNDLFATMSFQYSPEDNLI